jgi:RES domain-containing protein
LKSVQLGPDEVFYRFLTPKWSYVPLSGAGAATDGGRFNRPGTQALYLSRAPQTALIKYQQGASIVPPATLAAYKITLAKVADLSAGFDPNTWPPIWNQWDCNWRKIARIDKLLPPSWVISDTLVTGGFETLLFPSLRHLGGTNLVVFNSNLPSNNAVQVHDPHGSLPRDQSSWPA